MRIMVLFAVISALVLVPPALAENYTNISNMPFHTISNGPQNAIVVDVDNPNDDAAVQAAISSITGPASRAARNPLSRQLSKLREAGLMRQDIDPAIYRTVLVRSNGSFEPASRASRAYGGGTITFTYSGWSAADEALLKSFAQIAYPILVQVYGNPAKTMTVNVVNDTAQSEKYSLLSGQYITGTTGNPTIKLWRYASNISLERSFLYMMVRAFHDTAMFQYDAWEEGFARAAAVVAGEEIDKRITQNPSLGLSKLDFVGRGTNGADAFFYLMNNYEQLNQPALSNNTFFTSWVDSLQSGGLFCGMIIPRLGMSSTAWLKVYVERLRTDGQSFFKLFNEAYYEQLTTNASLAGNIPALKSIATNISSSVEGLPFEDWYRRQYILDTSVSIGKKLYAYSFLPTLADGPNDDYSMTIFLIHYATNSTGGTETPLTGTVYPVYWDYLYKTDLYTSSQYEIVPIENGEGYVTPSFLVGNLSAGAQRIAMDFNIASETARVYFPVGKSGTMNSPSTFLGVVVGANSGTVSAQLGSGNTTATTVSNGAFGTGLITGMSSLEIPDFNKMTITCNPTGGTQITRVVNVGPGSYFALIKAPSVGKTLTHTFPAGMRMISLPMTTFCQDQALALENGSGGPAIPANKLLIARWNPQLTDSYKYEMYPRTPAFAPGKGYWLKFPSTTIVTVRGEVPDPTGKYRISLVNGWNQIGGPFESPVNISSIMVERGNDEPISFEDAWVSGLIGKTIWKYTPGSGYTEAFTLDPWEGYWIKCNVPDGVVLIVPGPDNRSRAASMGASVGGSSKSSGGWSMKLTASSIAGDASQVTLGMSPGATDMFDNAFDAEMPPSFGEGVSLGAIIPGRAGGQCAVDTRSEGAAKVNWDMIVTPSAPNQDIVIRWQDITNVPKNYRLTLLDQTTGRSQYLRTTSSYRFNSGDGSPRRLTLIAESSPATRLMITNLMVNPGRGPNVSFSYNLTADAQVSAEILGTNGRRIRRLEPGRQTRSGINTLYWDKRDDAGNIVPVGVYTIQMNAVTEDGEAVKSVRPVILAR